MDKLKLCRLNNRHIDAFRSRQIGVRTLLESTSVTGNRMAGIRLGAIAMERMKRKLEQERKREKL